MEATITYLLSEQAQREAMVATGQPVIRKQTMTVKVEQADLKYFAISEDGAPYMDLSADDTKRGAIKYDFMKAAGWDYQGGKYIASAIENPIDAVKRGEEILKQEADKRAHKQAVLNAELDRDFAAFEADPTQRGKSEYSYIELMGRQYTTHTNNIDVSVKYGSIRKAIEDRNAADGRERKARVAAMEAAKEAEEAAKETEKMAFRKAWIAEHGTDLQKQQYKDKLLCKSAIHDLIAGHAFAKVGPAFDLPHFCDSSECPCGARSESCLPERLYQRWLEIKAKVPAATVTFRSFRACLQGDDYSEYEDGAKAGPRQYVATLSIEVGPFTFDRTVLLS